MVAVVVQIDTACFTPAASRDVDYGHKLNLTTGRSGLILDLVVEAGNPADSERLLPMLDRHIALYGEAPLQAAANGGYARRDVATANLRELLDSSNPTTPAEVIFTGSERAEHLPLFWPPVAVWR